MNKFGTRGLAVLALATFAACGTEMPTSSSTTQLVPNRSASVVTPSGTTFCSGTTANAGGWFVLTKNFNWADPIAGSTWIGPTATSDVDATRSNTANYSTTFELPAFTTASISGTASFDNDLAISVNGGGAFFNTGTSDNPLHFSLGNESFGTSAGLATGVNTVTFALNNDASPGASVDPTGLNFCFTLNYEVPPPTQSVAVFVIGDKEPHAVGDKVNFWGSQWWKNNTMFGNVDNGVASFKGYADISSNGCPGTWSSLPGNSSKPPASLSGAQIAVIVTHDVNKNGNNISGHIVQIVMVEHDGQYGPAPGHDASGIVKSVVCP